MKHRALWLVLAAQFCSAFADNVLLYAAIAMVARDAFPLWSIPILQIFFAAAYILFAPFVGAIADAYPKGRVMLLANGLKLIGAAAMALGLNPFIGYGLVGLGAAAYSPAKYGILSEILPRARLVKGNGWLEASTIVAILIGTFSGGKLSDVDLHLALGVAIALYLLAALFNYFIPRLPAVHSSTLQPAVLLRRFVVDLKILWRDGPARLALVGTSAFWGAGATLRFMLLAWVPAVLGIAGNTLPGYMNGVVGMGVVVGSAAAGMLIRLSNVSRALPAGVAIGGAIVGFALADSLAWAFVFCAAVGAFGGFFVVPLNALLQERGHATVGAGGAVAVQNFMANMAISLLVGVWIGLRAAGVQVVTAGVVFGIAFGLFMAWLWWGNRKLRTDA